MSSANDYLTKTVHIDRQVITFRRLSRALSLHVSAARDALKAFHEEMKSTEEPTFASYLISGEIYEIGHEDDATDDGMDVEEDYDARRVKKTVIMLVQGSELNVAKSSFRRIDSCDIYCLSPGPLKDPGLITEGSEDIRKHDSLNTAKLSTLGAVISPDVKRLEGVPVYKAAPSASTSKKTLLVKKDAPKPQSDGETSKVLKPTKKPGTLDFSKSKVKPKELPTKAGAPKPTGSQGKPTKMTYPKVKAEKTEESKTTSALMSDSETEAPSKPTKPAPKKALIKQSQSDHETMTSEAGSTSKVDPAAARQKRRIVDSDDEDVISKKATQSRKRLSRRSDVDPSMRAMMDVDDDQVTRIDRSDQKHPPPPPSEADSSMADAEPAGTETDDADVSMDVDMDDGADLIKPLPRKRKEKKVIPIGGNGLKKRRVMKTRTSTDKRGYMVTEDYSDWETAYEEEPDVTSKSKKTNVPKKVLETGPAKKPTKTDASKEIKPSGDTAKTKKVVNPIKPVASRPAGGEKQKTLKGFFGGGTKK